MKPNWRHLILCLPLLLCASRTLPTYIVVDPPVSLRCDVTLDPVAPVVGDTVRVLCRLFSDRQITNTARVRIRTYGRPRVLGPDGLKWYRGEPGESEVIRPMLDLKIGPGMENIFSAQFVPVHRGGFTIIAHYNYYVVGDSLAVGKIMLIEGVVKGVDSLTKPSQP